MKKQEETLRNTAKQIRKRAARQRHPVNKDKENKLDQELTCDGLEMIIDALEKEWFDLVFDLPKSECEPVDSQCSICFESECDNSNAIVFCDGCNVAVHQGRVQLI